MSSAIIPVSLLAWAPAARAAEEIEAVTVTATKVRTNLQKTPQAITAITALTLDKQAIVAPKDLDNIVPGMVVNSTPSNPLTITIRGAGYEGIENTSAQPGVSYNQDGVYIASTLSLNADFLDVASVEVLRGPQGTVLGQNSDGGAINVITVAPKLNVKEGSVEASFGSYNLDRLRGTYNLPLGDKVAVRFAVQQEKHDGWSYATQVPGTDGKYPLSNEDSFNARVNALYKPSADLSFDFWAEHYVNNTNGDAYKNIDDPSPNPYVVTQDWPTKMSQSADNIAFTATRDFDATTLRLIGSYQEAKLNNVENLDKLDYALAVPLLGVHDIDVANNREGHSYTAEVDLNSKPGSTVDWIVGAFYLQQRYNEAVEEYQYSDNPSSYAYAPYGEPLNLSASNPYYAESENFTGPIAFEVRDTQYMRSGSLYGQGTYHLTPDLSFILGGRGTLDNQIGFLQDYFGIPARNGGSPVAVLKTGFMRGTGKAEIVYDLTPANSVYGMVSDGIKPGGANLNPGAEVIPTVFQPESVTAFELGSKNQFLQRTLRVNISAFYNMVHNFQVDSEDPLPYDGGLTNLKAAHVDGVETEITQLLPAGLRLDGNATLQESRVDTHQQLFDPSVAEQIDLENGAPYEGNDLADRAAAFYSPSNDQYGHRLPKTPAFTGNLGITHTLEFANGDSLTSGFHMTYRSAYWFRVYNNPLVDHVPGQRQYDLNFEFKPLDGQWHVDFLIINLTNNADINSRYTDNFGTFITANGYVPPRQFIGRFGYNF